jgi:hypothetical protein
MALPDDINSTDCMVAFLVLYAVYVRLHDFWLVIRIER